jgi:Kef-type K+ transport system membrane component KefB/Trk K+ transport system NAD-binding subunit
MTLFTELSLLFGFAFFISIFMRVLRQPLIIGYIITGLFVGPIVISTLSLQTFNLFSEIGIAILLFIVGINLSPKTIKEFGRVALITGLGQVLLTSIAGYFISVSLGFSPLTSLYISIALSFSSTIIILKLISDRGDMETLYAKISIGFLLVQDFIAVILLFIIPLISGGESSAEVVWYMVLRGVFIIAVVLALGYYLLPKFNDFISKDIELLFMFATFWGIGIASLFKFLGFSIETGALIAGVSLSTLPSRHEISAKMTPLRDFFIIIFFIILGSHMDFSNLSHLLPKAVAFSLLVLVGNPIILMAIMGVLGYKKRTSLQTGFTVAQISEFSLIMIALGVTYGHLSEEVLSLVTLVGLITIFGSTYFILYSDKLFKILEPILFIFERKNSSEKEIKTRKYPIILFGGNRVAFDFIQEFKKMGKPFLVVDHNPEIIKDLAKLDVETDFGDAMTLDYLESLDMSETEFVVSTIPDSEANFLITRVVQTQNPKALVMVVSHKIQDALDHYKNGVDYVILPHFLGGKYAAELSITLHNDLSSRGRVKEDHIKSIMERAQIGHEHPKVG